MTHEFKSPDLGIDVPRQVIDQYFGVWAILEETLQAHVRHVENINLVAHVDRNTEHRAIGRNEDGDTPYAISSDGIVTLSLQGSMTKYASSMSASASTIRLRQQLSHAGRNDDVQGILLTIDSPGGTVAGTQDLANTVRSASQKKPVFAFCEDLCASAAFWVASQATRIVANNATAQIGSIGTFAVIYDMSRQAESLGIKVHVVRAGEFKGAGTPGTEITEQQIANWQSIVDGMNEEFLSGVAMGRDVTRQMVDGWANGRVYGANDALDMGLIDAVQTFEQTLTELVEASASNPNRRVTMSEEQKPVEPKTATLTELKHACPDATSDFYIEQLEKGATAVQALQAFNAQLLKDARAKEKEHQQQLEDAKAKAAEGVSALGDSGDTANDDDYAATNDPVQAFELAVSKLMESGKDRATAIRTVVRQNPTLHRAFLLATNPGQKNQRVIAENF